MPQDFDTTVTIFFYGTKGDVILCLENSIMHEADHLGVRNGTKIPSGASF